jgi:hypothetical protein
MINVLMIVSEHVKRAFHVKYVFVTILSFYDRITTNTAMPGGPLMTESNIEQTVFDFRFD